MSARPPKMRIELTRPEAEDLLSFINTANGNYGIDHTTKLEAVAKTLQTKLEAVQE